MTIGEKIRYFRKRTGITQGKLAELAGVHPVSIRKYETGKTIPQQPQIEKIAKALCISEVAISGTISKSDNKLIKTLGDFMGLLIMLIKNNVIIIKGERDENNAINPQTVIFTVNPLISSFFNAKCEKQDFNASKIEYYLKNNYILDDILTWEKAYFLYEKCVKKYSENNNDVILQELGNLKCAVDAIEIKLQHSTRLLTEDGKLSDFYTKNDDSPLANERR